MDGCLGVTSRLAGWLSGEVVAQRGSAGKWWSREVKGAFEQGRIGGGGKRGEAEVVRMRWVLWVSGHNPDELYHLCPVVVPTL